MKIIKEPYRIDFVDNNPKFVIKTQTEGGRRSKTTYTINRLSVGNIYIHTAHANLVWEIVASNPTENQLRACSRPDDIAEELAKIQLNYILREKYNIEIERSAQGVGISFETLEYEAVANVVIITSDITDDIGLRTNFTGTESTLKKKRVRYKFVIERNWPEGSIVSTARPYEIIVTPEFVVENESEEITINTSTLKPYLEELYDLPGQGVRYQRMLYNQIRYYLIADEEEPGEQIQFQVEPLAYIEGVVHLDYRDDYFSRRKVKYTTPNNLKSKLKEMVNGVLVRTRFEENRSDWDYNIMGEISEQADIIIWGQENGMTKRIYQLTDYIYVRNTTDRDIPVTYMAKYTDMQNDTNTTAYQMQIAAGGLYCFQMLPTDIVTNLALQNKVLKKIKVTISSEDETIYRNYIIIPKPYNAQILYLKNRLNLYEPFHITSTAKDMEAEGEEITVEETRQYSTTKKEVFTARTGLRNPKELKILEAAIDKKRNYIIENGKRLAIYILPDTIRTMDETEDMLEVEFKYIKGETL